MNKKARFAPFLLHCMSEQDIATRIAVFC